MVRRASYSLHRMMVEQSAGIPKTLAPPIGISVDHRRKNRSLRVFKLHAGDSPAEEITNATQPQGPYLPIAREKLIVELVKVTDELKSFKAYDKLCMERMNTRHIGARLKKVAEAEKEEKK